MSKRYLFICIGISLIFSNTCYSAPCYGTHMPKEKQWIWGLQGDFLIDRNLENDQGGTKGNRFFLTGSYGIFKWICFEGKIGVGDVTWHNSNLGNLDYNTGFAGGYGFRIRGYENKELGIKTVVGFQHISVHPFQVDYGNSKYRVIIDDWQGSALISKDIGRLVPYLGVRYGTVDFIKWVDDHDRKRIKSEKRTSLVIGTDYLICKDTRLNIEGDFVDGEEISIGISRGF